MADPSIRHLGMIATAKDQGASKGMGQLQKAIVSVAEKTRELQKAGMDAAKASAEAAKLQAKAMKDNAAAIDNQVQSLTSSVTMSSSLESAYVTAGVEAKKLAATTSVSQRDIMKNTSFFDALQMDAGELQKGFVQLKRAGIDVSQIGFKNFKDFAKMSGVVGVGTEQLAVSLSNLSKSYGFTNDEQQKFLDQTAFIGKELDIGTQAFQGMDGMLSSIDNHFAKLNLDATADDVTKLQKGLLLTAGAYVKMGGASDKAVGFATGLLEKMTDFRFEMQRMRDGAGGDLPQLLTDMGMAMGDFDKATAALEANDTNEFMSIMSGHLAQLRAGGKDSAKALSQFSSWVEGAFGTELMWGISNFNGIEESIAAVNGRMGEAEGAALKLSKAYSTTRTVQDRYNYASDVFEDRLFRVAKRAGTVDDVLKAQTQTHKGLLDLVDRAVKSGGPLGQLVQIYITYRKMGVLPAIAATIGFAKKNKFLLGILEKFEPQISAIRETLVGLATGEISLSDVFDKMLAGAKSKLASFAPELQKMGTGLLGGAALRFAPAAGPLAPLFAIVGGLTLVETHWKEGVVGFVDDAANFLVEYLPKLGEAISTHGPELVQGLGKSLGTMLKTVLSNVGAVQGGATAVSNALIGLIADGISTYADMMGENQFDIADTLGELLSNALFTLLDLGGSFLAGIIQGLVGEVFQLGMVGANTDLGPGGKIGRAVVKLFQETLMSLWRIPLGVLNGFLRRSFEQIGQMLMPDGLKFDLGKYYEALFDTAKEYVDSFVKTMGEVWDGIGYLWESGINKIEGLFTDMGGAASGFWDSFKEEGEMVLGLLSLGFEVYKHLVIHEVLAPVIRGIEGQMLGLIGQVQNVSKLLPDSLKSEAVLKFENTPLENFRLTTKLGLTEEARDASRKNIASQFASAGSAIQGSDTVIASTLRRIAEGVEKTATNTKDDPTKVLSTKRSTTSDM